MLQFCTTLCIVFYALLGFPGVFLPWIWAYFRYKRLKALGKNPWYFPVYERAVREQGDYPKGRLPGAHGFVRKEYEIPKLTFKQKVIRMALMLKNKSLDLTQRYMPPIYRNLVYDNPSHGLPDRIQYKYKLGNEVTREKNGTLVRSWRYECDDQTTKDRVRRSIETNEQLHTALRQLGPGWAFWSVYDQFEWDGQYPTKIFPTPQAKIVDEERRRRFEESENYSCLLEFHLAYYPPAGDKESKSRVYKKDKRFQQDARRAAYEQFVKVAAQIEEALNDSVTMHTLKAEWTEIDGRRIAIDKQLSSFNRAIKGRWQKNLRAPAQHALLYNYLGSERLLHRGPYLRVGNTLIKPITILDYPDETRPDLLEAIWNIPGNMRVVNRFIYEDQEKMKEAISTVRSQHQQQKDSSGMAQFKGGEKNIMPDHFKAEQVYDSEDAFRQVSANSTLFGYNTLTVLIFQPLDTSLSDYLPANATNDEGRLPISLAEDDALLKLNKTANAVIGSLATLGFMLNEELGNELEAYLAAMPGNLTDNVVVSELSLRNVCNLIFTSTSWLGDFEIKDPDGFYKMANGKNPPAWVIFNAENRKPFFFNPLSGSEGGHGMVIGKTGVGKSGTVGFLANQHTAYTAMLPTGARQIIIDKDGSHITQAEEIGGAVIRLSPDTEFGLAPFYDIEDAEKFSFAEGLLKIMAQRRDPNIFNNKENLDAIYVTLKKLAQIEPEQRTMEKLLSLTGMTGELQHALKYYSYGGQGQNLFNGNRPISSRSSFVVFEIADILGDSDAESLNDLTIPALLCLFNEVERMVADAIPTAIFAEEAWKMFLNEIADNHFNSLYKRIRKYGALIALIFHQPTDLDKSRNKRELLGATSWILVLPDEKLLLDDVQKEMEIIGLKKDQCEYLGRIAQQDKKLYEAGRGRRLGYLIKEGRTRLVSLKLDEVSRAVCATTSKNVIKRELQPFKDEFPGYDAHGPQWFESWLRFKGGEDWYRHYRDAVLPLYDSDEILLQLEDVCGLSPEHAA